MLISKPKQLGFTIVELLIVIIVIAILATLVITAYNGVQTKAKNTKTVVAVEAWVKAINLYHADTGNWPVNSCLGDSDTYDGDGICYDAAAWTVKASFVSSLRPYIGTGTLPSPDTTNVNTSSLPRRGALYMYTSGEARIYFMQSSVSSCPQIGGLAYISSSVLPGGVQYLERLSG